MCNTILTLKGNIRKKKGVKYAGAEQVKVASG